MSARIAGCAALAALLAAGALDGSPPRAAAPPATDSALARATALTVAAPLTRGRVYANAAEARSAAAAGSTLPLPDGGNFNGIRFEAVTGPLSAADVERALEHNAACQWWRALADGRQPALARQIVAQTRHWPALRGAPHVLHGCRASHRREVAYARAHGLQPSS